MADYSLDDLLYLMSRLRDPVDGCPWDLAQDFSSIVAHTIEESYELADAIGQADYQQIKEELGDVLFQVVFYSQLGSEQQQFEFNDIVSSLVDKLVRRHPHVFPQGTLHSRAGEQTVETDEINRSWEAIKAAEREGKKKSAMLDDVPMALPALTRAAKLQKRASQVGFDWDDIDQVLAQVSSEIEELKQARQRGVAGEISEELGDIIFSLVNVSRHLSVDPEAALRQSNRKFENRFRYIETAINASGATLGESSLEQMDLLWDEAKKTGL